MLGVPNGIVFKKSSATDPPHRLHIAAESKRAGSIASLPEDAEKFLVRKTRLPGIEVRITLYCS